MNLFIKPPFEKLEYGSCPHHSNNPVNLLNVKGIKKGIYKTGSYGDGLPSIIFLGTESENLKDGIVWVFPNRIVRNECFEAILNNRFGELKIED